MTGKEVLSFMDTNFIKEINKSHSGVQLEAVHSKITFEDVCRQITDLYNRKNADYDGAFEKSMNKWGLTAAAVRLGDKMNRFESLINNTVKVKDESIDDTLLDMASYAIMTYMWRNK